MRPFAAFALAALATLSPPVLVVPVLVSPALAGPVLRGDVTARRDTLTLGDLVDGVPAALSDTPLFRAPMLGQTGTIQAGRIAQAVEALGLGAPDTGGRLQVSITRSARDVGPVEIEAALKRVLAAQAGFDPVLTGVAFDGAPPSLLLSPDVTGGVEISDLVVDRRARRVAATAWIGPSATERRGTIRVTGSLVDLVEIPVVQRALERGETVKPGSVAIELRPRDAVPPDALGDPRPPVGQVAKRPLAIGTLLRAGDLVRPEIVARGEVVSAVYDAPGMSLSLRVTASAAGALGDTINVVNPQTKKVVQAVVAGPGRVTVGPGRPDPRLASAKP